MDRILEYFPDLSEDKIMQFKQLEQLYNEWNARINVISRKDMQHLYTNHVLHSLGIARVQQFKGKSAVLDVGTGGGFPGIPLAILFPETSFYLVDAIGKKIKVVDAVVASLGLKNVRTAHSRAAHIHEKFDFIVSRAVTRMPDFVKWVRKNTKKRSEHELKNGILYLKGGDLTEELKDFPKATTYSLNTYFEEDFFETKKVVHLPLKFRT